MIDLFDDRLANTNQASKASYNEILYMKNSNRAEAGIRAGWLRCTVLLLCGVALLSLAGCATQTNSLSLEGKPLSGYVQMTQVQAAYLGSGNAGSGILKYQGNSYQFNVGGLGVGGIGISKIEAKGEVYGLQRLRDFDGAYAQARYGFALGTASAGDLWLQNRKGVVMHLKAKREGLMLSLAVMQS
jgi:hypothetical protein